eukprot:765135-Hanusia_phi.AAC.1
MAPIQGGVKVSLAFQKPLQNMAIECMFGHIKSVCAWDNQTPSECSCLTPIVRMEGEVCLDVSVGGVSTGNNVAFIYRNSMIISSMTPTIGPESHSFHISIIGSNFVDSHEIRCEFLSHDQRFYFEANLISSSLIMCSGGDLEAGVYQVQLEGPKPITYQKKLTFFHNIYFSVSDVSPRAILARHLHTLRIKVRISNQILKSSLWCNFRNFQSRANIISSDELLCQVYQIHSGKIAFEIQSRSFPEFRADYAIEVLEPLSLRFRNFNLHNEGDETDILFASSMEIDGVDFYCVFGNVVVSGIVVQGTQIQCKVPSRHTSTVSIVAGFGSKMVDLSRLRMRSLQNSVSILNVHPSTGAMKWGSQIFVLGKFKSDDNIHCKFGSEPSQRAIIFNSTALTCVTPVSSPSETILSIIQESKVLRSFRIFFDAQIQVKQIHPLQMQIGRTIITIMGENFGISSGLNCQIGKYIYSTSKYVSSSLLECDAYIRKTGNYSLAIVDDTRVVWDGARLIVQRASLPNIFPSSGPIAGGTLIKLSFDEISSTSGYFFTCDFDHREYVNASVSGVDIECISPPSEFEMKSHLFVYGQPNKILLFQVDFQYFRDPSLHSLNPSQGPRDFDLLVTIFGEDFSLASKIWQRSIPLSSTFISSTMLRCVFSRNQRNVDQSSVISVSNNGVHFSSSTLTFAYITPVKFISISPQIVSCEEGVQEVTVIGENFDRQSLYQCSFGGRDSVLAD